LPQQKMIVTGPPLCAGLWVLLHAPMNKASLCRHPTRCPRFKCLGPHCCGCFAMLSLQLGATLTSTNGTCKRLFLVAGATSSISFLTQDHSIVSTQMLSLSLWMTNHIGYNGYKDNNTISSALSVAEALIESERIKATLRAFFVPTLSCFVVPIKKAY